MTERTGTALPRPRRPAHDRSCSLTLAAIPASSSQPPTSILNLQVRRPMSHLEPEELIFSEVNSSGSAVHGLFRQPVVITTKETRGAALLLGGRVVRPIPRPRWRVHHKASDNGVTVGTDDNAVQEGVRDRVNRCGPGGRHGLTMPRGTGAGVAVVDGGSGDAWIAAAPCGRSASRAQYAVNSDAAACSWRRRSSATTRSRSRASAARAEEMPT